MAIFGYFLPSAPDADRRHDSRRKLSLLARGAHHDGTGLDVLIHNISGTGMLFESDIKLAAGDRIEIELPHAGDITAIVIWASGRHFGCQFEGPVSPATLSAVELKSVTAPPPKTKEKDKAAREDEQGPATEVEESFGDRLQRFRTELGLDQAEVAKRMGVGVTSVASWEKGRARPKRGRMATLAAILGVEASDLLGDGEPEEIHDQVDAGRELIARALGVSADRIRIIVEY
ncbi:helix-turn-helix domain-containing protein [Sphingopyxis sp.]|uniref:helix-turn-helix domain-containing protein n=1 Tax=Sphingopyxis sp. TaxID=1908224 RepID=UPI003BAA5171